MRYSKVFHSEHILRLNANEFRVYVMLSGYANADGTGAYPSNETLMKICSVSMKTLFTCLKSLEEKGMIEREYLYKLNGRKGTFRRFIVHHMPIESIGTGMTQYDGGEGFTSQSEAIEDGYVKTSQQEEKTEDITSPSYVKTTHHVIRKKCQKGYVDFTQTKYLSPITSPQRERFKRGGITLESEYAEKAPPPFFPTERQNPKPPREETTVAALPTTKPRLNYSAEVMSLISTRFFESETQILDRARAQQIPEEVLHAALIKCEAGKKWQYLMGIARNMTPEEAKEIINPAPKKINGKTLIRDPYNSGKLVEPARPLENGASRSAYDVCMEQGGFDPRTPEERREDEAKRQRRATMTPEEIEKEIHDEVMERILTKQKSNATVHKTENTENKTGLFIGVNSPVKRVYGDEMERIMRENPGITQAQALAIYRGVKPQAKTEAPQVKSTMRERLAAKKQAEMDKALELAKQSLGE